MLLISVGQTKDRALADLETDNQRLKAELQGLQEDLAVQEEELAYQQRELEQLREHCHQQDTLPHRQGYPQKGESWVIFLGQYSPIWHIHTNDIEVRNVVMFVSMTKTLLELEIKF